MTLTSAAFLFLLLRLFAVAGYEWHTAFAVLHTVDLNDSLGIVLGTVMASSVISAVFIAALTPVALVSLLESRRGFEEAKRREREGAEHRAPDLTGTVLLTILLVMMVAYLWSFDAWWLPLIAAATTVVYFALAHGARAEGKRRRAALWAGRHLGVLLLVGLLVGAATSRTPWVPLEEIGLRDGAVLRGYVMQDEPGSLKVLTEKDRDFLILMDPDVASREELGLH
ncbi:hypothetical protein VO63_12425 [Streptomyces showdoensis]|uniref:Uncharacterized protein n=1 Tax=Streptomyces showdoensis TaxID=68268 RepID=A0A2P2GPW5_STREW|nr:hypothetical protein VO63_12425 [Streptomyces showdoensis]